MTRRSRTIYYGAAGLLIIVGAVVGPVVGGETGETVAFVLVGLGMVAIVGLVFFEVGLSEDQERERERRAARAAAERAQRSKQPRPEPRQRLGRRRGERRRLR